jgi:hypothetical protein
MEQMKSWLERMNWAEMKMKAQGLTNLEQYADYETVAPAAFREMIMTCRADAIPPIADQSSIILNNANIQRLPKYLTNIGIKYVIFDKVVGKYLALDENGVRETNLQ